jgi:hypothetical protein
MHLEQALEDEGGPFLLFSRMCTPESSEATGELH